MFRRNIQLLQNGIVDVFHDLIKLFEKYFFLSVQEKKKPYIAVNVRK